MNNYPMQNENLINDQDLLNNEIKESRLKKLKSIFNWIIILTFILELLYYIILVSYANNNPKRKSDSYATTIGIMYIVTFISILFSSCITCLFFINIKPLCKLGIILIIIIPKSIFIYFFIFLGNESQGFPIWTVIIFTLIFIGSVIIYEILRIKLLNY